MMTTLRNKALMLLVILLISFAWLAIEVSTWLMALMARGALSVARGNVYLFQINVPLSPAEQRTSGPKAKRERRMKR